MGKTRDIFQKIRDTTGTFHAKMGTIKDRNGMDLREVDLKKRWQEYTEELYKKDLHRGFSIHGVSQARTLEWVAISFSVKSSLVFPILLFSSFLCIDR